MLSHSDYTFISFPNLEHDVFPYFFLPFTLLLINFIPAIMADSLSSQSTGLSHSLYSCCYLNVPSPRHY